MRCQRAADDRGGAVVLVVAIVVVAATLSFAVAELGAAAGARSRAQTAADVAALAGAAGGEAAARDVAASNGATLESFRSAGGDVVVAVRLGRATARARARREIADDPCERREGRAVHSPRCPWNSQG